MIIISCVKFKLAVILLVQIAKVSSNTDIDCGIYVPKDFNWYYVTGSIHYVNDSTKTGSVAQVRCERGYDLVGPNTAYCGNRGNWIIQDRKLYCAEHKCPRPDYYAVPNGVIHPFREILTNQFIFGSAYAVTCNDGYVPNGSPIRTCLDNGTWSDGGTIPQCMHVSNRTIPCNDTDGGWQTEVISSGHWGEHFALSVCGIWALLGFCFTYKLATFTERNNIVIVPRTRFENRVCTIPKKILFSVIHMCLPMALQTTTLMKPFRKFFSITTELTEDEIALFQDKYKTDRAKIRNANSVTSYPNVVIDNQKTELIQQKTELDNHKTEIIELKAKIDKQNAEIIEHKTDIDKQKAEIDARTSENIKQKAEIDIMKAKLDHQKHELVNQKAVIDTQKAKLDNKKAKIDRYKAERNSQQEDIKTLQAANLDLKLKENDIKLQASQEVFDAKYKAQQNEFDCNLRAAKKEFILDLRCKENEYAMKLQAEKRDVDVILAAKNRDYDLRLHGDIDKNTEHGMLDFISPPRRHTPLRSCMGFPFGRRSQFKDEVRAQMTYDIHTQVEDDGTARMTQDARIHERRDNETQTRETEQENNNSEQEKEGTREQ